METKLMPLEAAKQLVEKYFPQCNGALLAGSVVRGEATDTSDLDIVIFDHHIQSAYRESLVEFGWPIEVFVHNNTSYQQFFESDCARARPSLVKMVSEGIIVRDKGIIDRVKSEADELLGKGPAEWSPEEITMKRYFLTDGLDDFIGCTNRAEEIFSANALADLIHEFVLRTNRKWIGSSKWIVRALKQFDDNFAKEFVEAFDLFYRTGDKGRVIQLADHVLEPYGGRLFEGFSVGKNTSI